MNDPLPERLERLASRAGLAIVWERVWPGCAAILVTAALFLAISFSGVWLEVPRWARVIGVLLFAGPALGILASFIRMGLPTRAQRLSRLDRDSGLPHQPATMLDDSLANNHNDPATRALWELHRNRTRRTAAALKVSLPSPRLVERDRYAIRGLALLAVAATGFIAGPEKYARVLAAFDWRTPGALSQGYRLDAWIDPPAYTGKPPVILNLREDAADRQKPGSTREARAPAGSAIIVRMSENANVTVETSGALQAPPGEVSENSAPTAKSAIARKPSANDAESRWILGGNARLTFKRFGSIVAAFDIAAIPDLPPTITIREPPKSNLRGSLSVGYKIDDDYGVIGAEANFSKPVVAGRPVGGRSLVEPPKMTLALPAGPGGLGEAETTSDLSEHPWAGARVTMILSARDEGGNEGKSDAVETTLPQRPFVKPLAKALVEQRRNLVLAPDDRKRVQTAMEALLLAPDRFDVLPGQYLGLSSVSKRLNHAKSDADLLEVADLMWEMALRIEDGGLSDAERDLRAAQQQLRDAMQRGASDEELKKLMEQLRAALDKFLNEMAQQAQRDPNNQDQRDSSNDNSRTITSQDLKSMLDKMEQMMREGGMAEAQRMLDQLQNLLENLQTARRPDNNRGDQMSREMNRALDELDQMTRDEQALRDETFRQGQQQRNRARRNQQRQQDSRRQGDQNQQGRQGRQDENQGDENEDGDDDQNAQNGQGDQQSLQQRQQALRQRLEDLKNRMKQNGMKGEEGLDDAEDGMKDAEGELGRGEQGRGKAVDAEGRALEGLRKGAQSLAQQMQQQGNQPGEGQGEQAGPGNPGNGQPRDGRPNANPDPLGRESHDRRDNNRQLYDPLGVPAAQRAQRVLEELRKRLGEQFRPREELDYLERLLKRY